jgi:hypothetical protein
VHVVGGEEVSAPPRSYSCSTRLARPLPGGRVGWQRQRAWMAGFSSLEMTYSSGPSGFPSHMPWYRSRTRVALARKWGSRMEIQDRYCQGLRASLASQRRTVDAEMLSTKPRSCASYANSGQVHRDSGTPDSAGN